MSRLQPPEDRDAGELRSVVAPVAPLLDGEGNRQREVLLGAGFRVLAQETDRCWGFAEADGYLGWVQASQLTDYTAPTHRIAAIRSYAKVTPDLKTTEPVVHLSRGVALTVTGQTGGWVAAQHPLGTIQVPAQHVAPSDEPDQDPAAIAHLYVGTPYLWGGNSAFGIDCSGLIQAALLTCGIPCPGDSDLQEAAFAQIEPDRLGRGDLVFWTGHVGMLLDARTLIHANVHHMAVTVEPLEEAIARIGQKEFGEVTSYRRP